MNRDDIVMRDRERLRAILKRYVQNESSYALIEFPDYGNVGDTAIWLGSLKLLSEITGKQPVYSCTLSSFNEGDLRNALPSDGVIFLQGGGNFGDIWPRFQHFREHVISAFRKYRIVHMPQSIHYGDASLARSAKDVIRSHAAFQMLVRDRRSLAFARAYITENVEIAPDAAFGLGALARPVSAFVRTRLLLRDDKERCATDLSGLNGLGERVDWLEDAPGFNSSTKWQAKTKALLAGKFDPIQRRIVLHKLRANARLQRGLKVLAGGEIVITDRLHAHILSILMDIPHVALDNNYGKIHAYMDAFTGAYDGVRQANSAAEALVAARSLSI